MPDYLSGEPELVVLVGPLMYFLLIICPCYLQCSIVNAIAAFAGGIYVSLANFMLPSFLLTVVDPYT
jgi:hypothetical protein